MRTFGQKYLLRRQGLVFDQERATYFGGREGNLPSEPLSYSDKTSDIKFVIHLFNSSTDWPSKFYEIVKRLFVKMFRLCRDRTKNLKRNGLVVVLVYVVDDVVVVAIVGQRTLSRISIKCK